MKRSPSPAAAPPPLEPSLSPLDQIRHVEAEITRQIAAARESSEKTISQARLNASQLKTEAQEAGSRAGESRSRSLMAEAEGEAQLIVAQARQKADELRRAGQQNMPEAARLAAQLVLGIPQTQEEPPGP